MPDVVTPVPETPINIQLSQPSVTRSLVFDIFLFRFFFFFDSVFFVFLFSDFDELTVSTITVSKKVAVLGFWQIKKYIYLN